MLNISVEIRVIAMAENGDGTGTIHQPSERKGVPVAFWQQTDPFRQPPPSHITLYKSTLLVGILSRVARTGGVPPPLRPTPLSPGPGLDLRLPLLGVWPALARPLALTNLCLSSLCSKVPLRGRSGRRGRRI